MTDAAPAHVRDMQEAVQAAQVDKGAEIGNVLDQAGAQLADLDVGQQALALFAAALFDQIAAGQHDVAAFAVNFHDLEFEPLAEVVIQVAHRDDVKLGAGQESLDPADVHDQAALYAALDFAFQHTAFLAGGEHIVPHALLFGLGFAQDDFAIVVLDLFQHDFDGIAGLQGRQIPEFLAGNEAFGFVADIYKHFIIADFHHFAGNDGTFLEVL